jgi:hypothetical protein
MKNFLNIIIIGNGFDLSHGYKTDYGSFVENLFQEAIQDSSKHNNLFEFGQKDTSGFSSNQIKIKKLNRYIYPKNRFFGKITKEFENKNWSDIEELYYRELINSNEQQIIILNKEFELIKTKLKNYLNNTIEHKKSLVSYSTFFNKLNRKSTIILNFNYTNTLKELYFNETSECKIINLHGELNNSENPIIFGYSASQSENYELLARNNSEYLINIKTYNYKKTGFEKYLNNYYAETEFFNSDLFIIGHSCSISDRNILNKLFNVDRLNSINILFYKNFEYYKDALINIHRIMESEKNYDQIINFDNSMSTPQITDTTNEIRIFENKLNKYYS